MSDRTRIGACLCLSGGGYRAALFHLGAVRRLNELGVLGGLRSISAVSGGAIVANLLADPRLTWPDEQAEPDHHPTVEGLDTYVATPLHRLCSRNIRTPALLSRLLPWRWFTPDATTRALAGELARSIGWWRRALRDNATDGPGIVTGATEIGYGVEWTFADPNAHLPRGRVGDDRLGYAEPPPTLRIADVVATSCAQPPYFAERRLDGDALGLTGGRAGPESAETRRRIRHSIRLTDGGVYDDLAVTPVWRDHAWVLVSDGGTVFRPATEHTWWGRMLRILDIAVSGASQVRLRWLTQATEDGAVGGAAWGIDDVTTAGGYPRDTVRQIEAVRTDLDAFSEGEQQVLERHGYFVTDALVRRDAPGLVRVDAPLVDPQPDVAEPTVAAHVLRDSANRTLLGRR